MKETVYVSEYLKEVEYGNSVFKALECLNIDGEINLEAIKAHKKNVWARDFMPVKGANGHWLHFMYAPLYTTDTKKWSQRCPNREALQKELEMSEVLKVDGMNYPVVASPHPGILMRGGEVSEKWRKVSKTQLDALRPLI